MENNKKTNYPSIVQAIGWFKKDQESPSGKSGQLWYS